MAKSLRRLGDIARQEAFFQRMRAKKSPWFYALLTSGRG
jgi:hypothetical protein